MKRGKNGQIYRPMIWTALQTAWRHKELWPFALFAGLAGSGVVVNDLLQQAKIALTPGDGILTMISGNIGEFFIRYAQLLLASGSDTVLYHVFGAVLILAGGAFLIVLCQQLLLVALHRAIHKKTRLTGRDLLRSLHHHHYLRILGVNLLFHVIIFIILGGGGVLMRNFSLSFPGSTAVVVFIAAATLFLAFIFNILAMLTLIAVGEERTTIIQGFLEGLDRFLRHPLVACETALLIFATNLVLSLVYIFGLTLIGIPIALLFAEAISKGILFAIVFITLIGAILAIVFTVLAAGFMTTFTYGVWILLAKQLDRLPFSSRFHHHIRKHFVR